eukprot:TRINITY_DN3301_c1_g2_i1.p1 TRINITY_DN3301_c1_g2~~TRINITY_DN3301_c1_g2_i1.p1  ORF type:complete len:682 (-),score=141.88 TRINITY_DN3301_c1_g2_i1:2-1972(-)
MDRNENELKMSSGKSMTKEMKLKQEKEKEKKSKLMTIEEREEGSVSFSVYWSYIVAIGGIFITLIIFFAFVFEQSTRTGSDLWLSYWSGQNSEKEENNDNSSNDDDSRSVWFYLGIYAAWTGANVIFVFIRALTFVFGGLNAAKKLHSLLLSRVIRAPMSFFDTTPTGRILNRFTKDVYVIDEVLPRTLAMLIGMLFSAVAVICVISYVTPFFLCALLPLAYVYYAVQQYYIASSREIKRLDGVSRSPIYAHFTETLHGVTTIRAFSNQRMFIESNEAKVDRNLKAHYASFVSNRWLGVRLEVIGSLIVGFAALFAVVEKDNVDPGLAGLSISYSLTITGILNWMVRQVADMETQMVSVERLSQYSTIEQESDPILWHNRPRPSWPERGVIELDNISLRYRPGLPFVLQNLSAKISEKEKIGVVGRTGAGKSSLMLALFRLVELSSGKILIDGKDISLIGLDDLRSVLSIIPQDPTLFHGTIKTNLDPFNHYTDDQILDVLSRVNMREAVENTFGGINGSVTEYGENWSVGQRQLLCLGRAMLRRSKILVLDEATAAVDYETDKVVQETIRREFESVTVLTIAHRLGTIMDYDRVMVLERGRLVEFDTVENLLKDERGVFYGMVNDAGKKKKKRRSDEDEDEDSESEENESDSDES